jgi:hypothetical protein
MSILNPSFFLPFPPSVRQEPFIHSQWACLSIAFLLHTVDLIAGHFLLPQYLTTLFDLLWLLCWTLETTRC